MWKIAYHEILACVSSFYLKSNSLIFDYKNKGDDFKQNHLSRGNSKFVIPS